MSRLLISVPFQKGALFSFPVIEFLFFFFKISTSHIQTRPFPAPPLESAPVCVVPQLFPPRHARDRRRAARWGGRQLDHQETKQSFTEGKGTGYRS